MNFYQTFEAMAKTRKRKLAGNTYLVVREDGGYGVKLHDTEIVIHYPDRTVFHSGGWKTATTKDRMNAFSDHRIHAKKGVWYIDSHPYADGVTVYDDGRVVGKSDDPKETEKLRRRVDEYAKNYADALIRGEVYPPSTGDCWACALVAKDGRAPFSGPEHIIAHMEERYYVPSLVVRQMDSLSRPSSAAIGRLWHNDIPIAGTSHEDFVRQDVRRAVRKFCLFELGLPV